jgi:O-acetyl-ADP-ribose deacetylase (regulator of RNase III)
MSCQRHKGDLFQFAHSEHYVIAHGCNVKGKMYSGIAAQFSAQFPAMEMTYRAMCSLEMFEPGDIFPWWYKPANDSDSTRNYVIINMMTQRFPGPDARLEWVKQSLDGAITYARKIHRTLVIPEIGCGIGGLDRETVYKTIFDTYDDLIVVEYAPT